MHLCATNNNKNYGISSSIKYEAINWAQSSDAIKTSATERPQLNNSSNNSDNNYLGITTTTTTNSIATKGSQKLTNIGIVGGSDMNSFIFIVIISDEIGELACVQWCLCASF